MNSRVLFLFGILAFTLGQVKAEEHMTGKMFVSELDTVFTMVDVMPEIKGGLKEFYKQIKYPNQAQRERIEGRVFIKFIVDENGDVKNPEILKDIGGGCGEAAIEGIQKVKFTPGRNAGQPVSVYYTLPVTFRLEN
ncbi:MAG: energy transducer TonB [Balneolales bacterium]|nr:energy transducer TonB [Balneolales bacterium]